METFIHRTWLLLIAAAEIITSQRKDTSASHATDEELKRREFLSLLEKNQSLIWQVVHLYCHDTEARRDLFQDMLLRLWSAFPNFRHESAFTTWAYKICLYTALSSVRKKSLPVSKLDKLPDHLHPRTRYTSDAELNFTVVLDNLHDVDKMIIYMLAEDYNYEEIASVTGLSTNAITKRIKVIRVKIEDQNKT